MHLPEEIKALVTILVFYLYDAEKCCWDLKKLKKLTWNDRSELSACHTRDISCRWISSKGTTTPCSGPQHPNLIHTNANILQSIITDGAYIPSRGSCSFLYRSMVSKRSTIQPTTKQLLFITYFTFFYSNPKSRILGD